MPAPLVRIETTDAQPQAADVVVIGGGIVGVFAAYYLGQRGLKVVLVEKGLVGAEQSSRNWGWCRQQNRDARELPLSTKSLDLWDEFAAETGENTGFRRCGLLYLSKTRGNWRAGRAGGTSPARWTSPPSCCLPRRRPSVAKPRVKSGQAVSFLRLTAPRIRPRQRLRWHARSSVWAASSSKIAQPAASRRVAVESPPSSPKRAPSGPRSPSLPAVPGLCRSATTWMCVFLKLQSVPRSCP